MLELHDGAGALPHAEAVHACFAAVFDDDRDVATWRRETFDVHAGREGFRLVLARDGDGVVGLAWGYVGRRGQYWPDLVADALPPEVVASWVGGHFEVVELGVLAGHRGGGLGRRLLAHLLDGVGQRALLGTADDVDDPAVRLYLDSGWRRLGALRPGVQVMGREAP